ncbi:MAG: hypothetical protein PHR25_02885 [Clostridia bacterium]|nr:hypothetical protein [Clostridia bacterium]MDD4375706.1 hypothetical protein [Clostridia bacterium]
MKKYDLTFPQKNIYLIEKFFEKTSINNIVGVFEILEGFNEEICNKVINKMVELNERIEFTNRGD